MKKTRRISMSNALVVCLVTSQFGGTLFASEMRSEATPSSSAKVKVSSELFATSALRATPIEQLPTTADGFPVPLFTAANSALSLDVQTPTTPGPLADSPRLWHAAFDVTPSETQTFLAQRGGYGGRGYRGRHSGAAAAVAVGAAAAIAGTAILVYANRPECSTSRTAGGCGYGTKVVGGAVLAGGVVGLVVAAATW